MNPLSLTTLAFTAPLALGTGIGLYAQDALEGFIPPESQWVPLAAGIALGALIGGLGAGIVTCRRAFSPQPLKSREKSKKAEEAFHPQSPTNIFFITGTFSSSTFEKEQQSLLLKKLEEGIRNIPVHENIVILGHETLHPFSSEDPLSSSLLARFFYDLWEERPSVIMLLGSYLFSANGCHRRLDKRFDPRSDETYPVSFRVCASLRNFELSEASDLYFVAAAYIEDRNSDKSKIRSPSHQTIYINDHVLGIRRIMPDQDSEWLDPLNVHALDDADRKHFIIRLTP